MRVSILNYAVPEPDPHGLGTRWWHKSGSRWPATLLNRKNDGVGYYPWPFLMSYLTSMLAEDGHAVSLLDGCTEQWQLDDAVEAVRHSKPDFIVFETSEQTEHSDPAVLEALAGTAPVLLIGPNVAEDRLDLLAWPGVQATVPGEYLASVVDFFRNPTAGIQPRQEIIGRDKMDALPFAYRDPERIWRYNARFKTTPPGIQGQFVSMWGCQYRCKFCIWIHAYWSRSSQFKKQFSIPRLEAELEWMLRTVPGITSLYDDSDNHDYHGDEGYAFAEMMSRFGLPWAILTRADTYMKPRGGGIDHDMWRAYRKHGLHAVKIGIEGAQATMDATNKRLDEAVVREFVPFMQDLGVSVYASFMLGAPNTTPEDDRRTLELIDDLASYRPELFEYLISHCDVTRVTPFHADDRLGKRLYDGQLGIEHLQMAGELPLGTAAIEPNNLLPETLVSSSNEGR